MSDLKPGRELDYLVAEKVMGCEQKLPHEVPNYSTVKPDAAKVVYAMLDKPDRVRNKFLDDINFIATKPLTPYQETSIWFDQINPYEVCLAALKALGAL